MGWGHSCRLRHVTSGRYLAATADNQVVTYHRSAATEEATAFVVRESKVRDVALTNGHSWVKQVKKSG